MGAFVAEWRREVEEALDRFNRDIHYGQLDLITLGVRLGLEAAAKVELYLDSEEGMEASKAALRNATEIIRRLDPTSILKEPRS